MGGRPKTSTPADMRLKENRDDPKKKADAKKRKKGKKGK
jgi:hypothetical protein